MTPIMTVMMVNPDEAFDPHPIVLRGHPDDHPAMAAESPHIVMAPVTEEDTVTVVTAAILMEGPVVFPLFVVEADPHIEDPRFLAVMVAAAMVAAEILVILLAAIPIPLPAMILLDNFDVVRNGMPPSS